MIFHCVECGVHYLPPEDMHYADGQPASPLWCAACHATMRELGITEPPAAAAVALHAARAALNNWAPTVEEPTRPDVRPSRPARTRRASSAPGGSRSKLH